MDDELSSGRREALAQSNPVVGDDGALGEPDISQLVSVVEGLADDPDSMPLADVYDANRSSSGLEYRLAPDAAGFYTLTPDGRPVEVSVRYVTDPETKHDVLTQLDEGYAIATDPDNLQ